MRPSSSPGGTKTPCCAKVGLKKGPWTPEEDDILSRFINKEGEGRWRTLPKRAGLLRCGKSCRLRWMNYLRPNVKRGHIAPDEEDLILRLHRLLGNRWSLIAGRIPGRTDNEIKNYWNTHLSKKLISQGIDPRTHKPLENYLIASSSNMDINNDTGNGINNNHFKIAVDQQEQQQRPNFNGPSSSGPVLDSLEAERGGTFAAHGGGQFRRSSAASGGGGGGGGIENILPINNDPAQGRLMNQHGANNNNDDFNNSFWSVADDDGFSSFFNTLINSNEDVFSSIVQHVRPQPPSSNGAIFPPGGLEAASSMTLLPSAFVNRQKDPEIAHLDPHHHPTCLE